MIERLRIPAAVLALLGAVSSAAALTPKEVLVVANANSPESIALGEFYRKARGIDEKNLLRIKTTTKYALSRAKYESEVAGPIREHLKKHGLVDQVRCICLMWGVPVRVSGAVIAGDGGVQKAYKVARTRAHHRLAIDYKLLGTVGKSFPAPKTDSLKPLGKLFKGKTPPLPKKLQAVKAIGKNVRSLLETLEGEVAGIDNDANKRIAQRQIMAIRLNFYGLNGLISYVAKARPAGAPKLEDLKSRLAEAKKRLDAIRKAHPKPTPDSAKLWLAAVDEAVGAWGLWLHANGLLKSVEKSDASLDSELAMLWVGRYKLGGWQMNALHWRARPAPGKKLPHVLMASRIDGPTPADARRIIADSIAVEKIGLKGTFYIDAAAKIAAYDARLKKLHTFVTGKTRLKSVLDVERKLFAPGTCPDAALYVGWYSLKKYIPAFTWVRGSVGWHVASFEAMHLRDPKSNEWCPKMIRNGVAATVGAVNEPYLHAFPPPEEFFSLLLTGKYTVAECYWRTCLHVSWRMTLIADPLYNPFAANPQVKLADLPPGLAPALKPVPKPVLKLIPATNTID